MMLSQFRFLAQPSKLRVSLFVSRAASSTMGNRGPGKGQVPLYTTAPRPKVTFSEAELRQRLSPEQFRITQEKGTERAGAGERWMTSHPLSGPQLATPAGPHLQVKEDGVFYCVVCSNQLFKTDAKFDSGTGWPSFSDVANLSDSVVRVVDASHGMVSQSPPLYIVIVNSCHTCSPSAV